jgi:hypothetical protein
VNLPEEYSHAAYKSFVGRIYNPLKETKNFICTAQKYQSLPCLKMSFKIEYNWEKASVFFGS